MMKEVPINYVAERFRQVTVRPLDKALIQAVLNKADGGMTEDENQSMLVETFTSGNLLFVKGKVEKALRKNGKSTPGRPLPGGGYRYSTIDTGEFDTGVRQGEEDRYGLSGVTRLHIRFTVPLCGGSPLQAKGRMEPPLPWVMPYFQS